MVTAIVHTYNEEENIERCLRSLIWTDEIIVIDMGSTDKTCQIVKEYKGKIYQHPYVGFADPARNFGIQKASGDWIISLDADEEMPRTLVKYLTLEAKNPSADYFRIPRKNIIFGKWMKHTGWWPDYQIRFFRKGSVSWTEKVHGIPLVKGKGADLEANEDLCLNHYNYQTIEQYLSRANRYSSLMAKEIFLSNKPFTSDLLFKKPLQEFINRYFIWEGYKDNLHGFVLAMLQSVIELVIYLKLWELYNFKEEKTSLNQISKSISYDFRQKKYWIYTQQLKNPGNLVNSLLIKLKRKLVAYGL